MRKSLTAEALRKRRTRRFLEEKSHRGGTEETENAEVFNETHEKVAWIMK